MKQNRVINLDAARITSILSSSSPLTQRKSPCKSNFSASCSHVRSQELGTQTLVSGKTGTRLNKQAHTAGGRDQRRRLNKLSCAGWLPHDRGFVSGCLVLDGERRLRPAHNRSRGFPDRALPPAVSAWRCLAMWCVDFLLRCYNNRFIADQPVVCG